ncbi:RING-H2 finger protein ATL57 (RING-type E3 ubiquitin transferase ATL57) [Durusdinium trenchii]|uniref:RING-H2 finger protein ATL57 (RING-type E3 ubiquitin transferase ATL57) n=1 Tax=Durusdinium trenchii TaxID=1381693 RepID=A0ABP0RT56_9DINO
MATSTTAAAACVPAGVSKNASRCSPKRGRGRRKFVALSLVEVLFVPPKVPPQAKPELNDDDQVANEVDEQINAQGAYECWDECDELFDFDDGFLEEDQTWRLHCRLGLGVGHSGGAGIKPRGKYMLNDPSFAFESRRMKKLRKKKKKPARQDTWQRPIHRSSDKIPPIRSVEASPPRAFSSFRGVEVREGFEVTERISRHVVPVSRVTQLTELERFLEELQYRDVTPEDYERLLLLDEENKRRTLDPRSISNFPKVHLNAQGTPESSSKIDWADDAQLREDCAICFMPFENCEATKLPCGHIFHANCTRSWFTEYANTCPIDRTSFSD